MNHRTETPPQKYLQKRIPAYVGGIYDDRWAGGMTVSVTKEAVQ